MGRSKARPVRRPQTCTIVGAAAIAASATPPVSSSRLGYQNEEAAARVVPMVTAVTQSVSSSSLPSSSPRHRRKTVTFNIPPKSNVATVTPTKSDHTIATAARSRKKRKFGAGDAKDDEDDDVVFDQSTSSVRASRKIFFGDDEDTTSAASDSGSHVIKMRRRIVDDDTEEETDLNKAKYEAEEATDGVQKEQSQQHFTIGCGYGGTTATLINIPSSVKKIGSSITQPTDNKYELVRFHLLDTKMVVDGDDSDHGVVKNSASVVVLDTIEAVETMLKHCNQQPLDSDDDGSLLLDIDPILRAFENGMIDVALTISTAPADQDKHEIDVSIRLLMEPCIEKLTESYFKSSRTPPIPIPRKLAGRNNNSASTKPHLSYTLLQALGGIFTGSIFGDVAKSLVRRQLKKKDKITDSSFITAKMVYSVVDNVHSEEFEDASSESSLSLDIPGLVPTLRPYQVAAVRWMLKREGKHNDANAGSYADDEANNEWELCWTVVVEYPKVATAGKTTESKTIRRSHVMSLPEWRKGKSAPDERRIFCNPFSGWLASSYDEAKDMMLGKEDGGQMMGGILAESMGLGKTVEVIACILANPSPLSMLTSNAAKADLGGESKIPHVVGMVTQEYQNSQKISASNSVTKPSAIHDASCICGRPNSYKYCLSWVMCGGCGGEMHGRCAGFESEEELVSKTTARTCTSDCCPTCVVFSIAQNPTASIIESRATLIVTPPAILTQWQKEISRHTRLSTTGKPLKVVIYPGVKELCRAGSSTPHEDFHLAHPFHLADADVVLVTFQTLMSDLGHSDENPFAGFAKRGSRLRSRKRYAVLPSPLTCVKWWRVCLDEAQRVEAPTAASARMARKLMTERRWCVSGTPIGRGRLDDLYGLLLFLSSPKPFDEKRWFSNSFDLCQGDALKRLSHLLENCMWRSTKANKLVSEQMGIPEQKENKIMLQFSTLERYFYRKQYEETTVAVNNRTEAKGHNLLNHSLQKLRAACCHPQVGTSGIGGRIRRQQGSSMVLSMDQILEKLIHDAKLKCEETQRLATLRTIVLAGLTKLEADAREDVGLIEKSMTIYQEALDMAAKNAVPTKIIGPAVLSGSSGFQLHQKTISNGATVLDWRIKSSERFGGVWSSVTFAGPARKISCFRVRQCHTLHPELQGEVASMTILRPKECILQMSTAGVGFVDVHAFTILDNSDARQWKKMDGFFAKKSKAWRFVIKSYHNDSGLESSSALEPCQYYAGLDVQLFEPEIVDDPLQRLQVLHNASAVLSAIVEAGEGDANNDAIARLKAMGSEEQAINDNYMAHAESVHSSSKNQLYSVVKAREKCDKELGDLSGGSNRTWYEDALAWFALYGDDKRDLCDAVRYDLANYYANMSFHTGLSQLDYILIRKRKFPSFHTMNGLHAALVMRIQQGEDEVGLCNDLSQNNCVQTVMDLSSKPTDVEVDINSHCQRCRKDWNRTGPVCPHCHLEDNIVKFQRLSKDPEISCVLKAISNFAKDRHRKASSQSKKHLQSIHQRSSKFFELQDKIGEEIDAAKNVWKAHFNLLSVIDELTQHKRAMRLMWEGEDILALTENEASFIVEPGSIDVETTAQKLKRASALAELRRNQDSLRYLKNQRRERKTVGEVASQDGNEKGSVASNAREICAVCFAAFDDECSVLPCGHYFHGPCVDRLFPKRSGGATIRCPMRCPLVISREDVLVASEKSKEDGSRVSRKIKGDWGTKVNRLVGDVMDARQMFDKGIIFSQWEEMLDVVAEALGMNQILFIRPRSGKRFGEDIKRFCLSDCPMLLMNIKNGAEGLTLTEANHVFMLEPILNGGLDAQAINRIHRIGQVSKTYVHRYIVSNTIEEKIDAIRIERQENHFEDDLREQQKHSIKGGGIDGGFNLSELDQLFG